MRSFLKEKGVNYLLVEGRSICSGITKNTTAKITVQHGMVYADLLKIQRLRKKPELPMKK